jgi:heme/copper-type cytochrome/quinol oxidase subunit 1
MVVVIEAAFAVVSQRDDPYISQDTYYVVAHWHYALSLVAACAVFALAYVVLCLRPLSRLQSRLGWAHIALMFVGLALILAPSIGLNFAGMPKRHADYPGPEILEMSTAAQAAGYWTSLSSLAPFSGLVMLKLAHGWRSRRGVRE